MRKQTITVGKEYGNEYQGTYVFTEITWAKRSRIIQKHQVSSAIRAGADKRLYSDPSGDNLGSPKAATWNKSPLA
jgi:hypothetical protein